MKPLLTSIVLAAVLLCGGIVAAGLDQQQPPAKNARASHSPETGEQVFQRNCGRCHTPPMTISQRSTGTVIMHMRVRARLSSHDEQLLLKYMAP